MTASTENVERRGAGRRGAFWRGLLAAAPFLLVAAPFATLFGVVAAEAGLQLAQIMGFTSVVIAGASQFAALQMMGQDAPVWAVVAAGLAVNLRMAVYSAALVPHLGPAPLWQRALVAYANFDMTYAASIAEYEARPAMTVRQRVAYFAGTASLVVPVWIAFTAIGAVVGAGIPEAWALDFALPITFLAILAPMLRSLAHVAAAGTSAVVALALGDLPAGTGLLVAGAVAMCVGAGAEMWAARR